jgi:hypothetical protein
MDDTTRGVGAAGAAGRDAGEDAASARTREIRAEIDQTRENMTETIDAIQERLRPASIVAQARDRVRSATSERMQQMAGEGNRQNLVPAALIGIGTAWLLMNRGDSPRRRSTRWYPEGSRVGSADYNSGDEYYRAVGTRGTAGGEDIDTAEGQGSGVSGMAGRATGRAGEFAQEARTAVRRTSYRAQNQFSRMLDDNPLAVGAAALALGAVVGLAFPETERENEWMGEAKENVVERAKETAREAADRVKDAAGQAAVSSITGSDDKA